MSMEILLQPGFRTKTYNFNYPSVAKEIPVTITKPFLSGDRNWKYEQKVRSVTLWDFFFKGRREILLKFFSSCPYF